MAKYIYIYILIYIYIYIYSLSRWHMVPADVLSLAPCASESESCASESNRKQIEHVRTDVCVRTYLYVLNVCVREKIKDSERGEREEGRERRERKPSLSMVRAAD